MKIIYNKILPFGRKYYAINLFGVIFAKGACSPVVLNHEKIHTAQIRELLYIPFYIFYVAEWLIRTIQFRNSFEGYKHISFEREAYENDHDLSYLKRRKMFSFRKYF